MSVTNHLRINAHRFAIILAVVLILGWLFSFLDSFHKRQRAEHFISELKSFPFATAGFGDVRALMDRNGGTSLQQFPNWRLPHIGLPHGPTPTLVPEGGGPTCTVQDCIFEIRINPRPLGLVPNSRAAIFLRSVLAHVGIRPWGVFATFEIKRGRLDRSRTQIGQASISEMSNAYGFLDTRLYTVECVLDHPANLDSRDYVVGPQANNLNVENFLMARLVRPSSESTRKAFDVHLGCFTTVARSCNGFHELAPSAWAEYQKQ